jgi:hypothetical protein
LLLRGSLLRRIGRGLRGDRLRVRCAVRASVRGETVGAAYRVRFGGTYNHIEVENSDGQLVTDSGHGLGWEIGTGVIVPFGDSWRLTPGVRYRSLGRTLHLGAVGMDVDLTYMAVEIGFAHHF